MVDSRKFSKLKRQASELQREIEQGERLKTLIDQEGRGGSKEKDRASRSKGKGKRGKD